MALIIRAKQADNIVMMQEAGNLAAKLLGLYERQFATLLKARKPPQVVTVEHVHKHLHIDGQQTPGPMGEVIRIEGQPHGANDPRAVALAPSPALLGEDQAPEPVSVTSNAERPLPNPRRPLAGRAKR